MELQTPGTPRQPGRPRSFNRDAALEQAMLLFWEHGYEATSVNDLVAAMGITPPSLYSAFGDKKQLFLEAIDRYLSGDITSDSIISEAVSGRAAAQGLLTAAAHGFTGAATPRGCLLASSAISCSAQAADVQKALARIRRGIERQLQKKALRDQECGRLAKNVDAGALAAHVMAVIQGMSTLARDGASRNKLLAVANSVMLAWPE